MNDINKVIEHITEQKTILAELRLKLKKLKRIGKEKTMIYNNSKRYEKSFAAKLINFLKESEPGTYKKKYIQNQIEYTNYKNFAREVLKHNKVMEYMDANGIISTCNNIIIPSTICVQKLIVID